MLVARKLIKSGHRLVIAVTVLWGGAVCAAEGMRPSPVVVEQAELRQLAPLTWVAGSVVSRNDAELAAEVAGRLLRVADEGTVVAAGATLARLDDDLIRADLAAAEAEVKRARADETFLRKEAERLRSLLQQGGTTQAELDQALARHDVASAAVAAAEARLESVRERLDRSVIKAPFAGVVTARLKRTGEWAAAGDGVVRLAAASDLEIEATAPLALRKHLSVGQRVVLQSDDGNGVGRIRTIVPVADGRSRLLTLRLDVAEGEWTAGQPLRVALPSAKPREVLTVSRDALILRRSGTSLFKVGADNMAQPVPVETGMAAGPYIEVRGPLQPGDRVVIRGNERLRPGQPVDVKGEGKGGAAAQ